MRYILKLFYLWIMPAAVAFVVLCSVFPEYAFPNVQVDVNALRIMSALMVITYGFVWFSVREAIRSNNQPISYEQWLSFDHENMFFFSHLYDESEFQHHTFEEKRREIYVRYISEFYESEHHRKHGKKANR
jgi:ABC-type nickel/cobalt efflux system permease component RcnA